MTNRAGANRLDFQARFGFNSACLRGRGTSNRPDDGAAGNTKEHGLHGHQDPAPQCGARHGIRRHAALARREARHRTLDGRRILLRLRSRAPPRRRGLRGDRTTPSSASRCRARRRGSSSKAAARPTRSSASRTSPRARRSPSTSAATTGTSAAARTCPRPAA